MKILFFGDSITDMRRDKANDSPDFIYSYGSGYPMFVAGKLYGINPSEYEIFNRGISGNKVVDLYARVNKDVWNLKPDVLSILIGLNDVWDEVTHNTSVDIQRFEKVYSMLIEDTKERLPNTTIILCEPFILPGTATIEHSEKFDEVFKYAKVVNNLAKKYDLYFLPLQARFDELAKVHGAEHYLYDGIHPMVAGANLIATEWTNLFLEQVVKDEKL